MAYIGNDLEVAFQSYLIIDDISSGFDGSETSFTLNVNGAVPVPFPINPQQCLISVAGVIQEPDPSGSSGFNLSGNNIVFSSPPAGSSSFFGVVLAGADYVNVGVDFPAGSESAPSITFVDDKDSGFFSKAANEIGIACAGTEVGVFSATGLSSGFADGSAASPSIFFTSDTNTGIARAAADELIISAGGVERVSFGSSEVAFNDPSNDVDFRVESNGETHMLFVDAGNDRVGIGTSSPNQTLKVVKSSSGGTVIEFTDNTNATGRLGTPSSQVVAFGGNTNHSIAFGGYSTDGSSFSDERLRIDTSGNVGIGTTSPGTKLDVNDGSANCTIRARTGTGFSSFLNLLPNGSGSGISLAANSDSSAQLFNQLNSHLAFGTNNSERLRIDSSGNVGIGTTSPSFSNGSGIELQRDGTACLRIHDNTNSKAGEIYADSSGLVLDARGTSAVTTFDIGGSEKMRLDNSGRLLINHTADAAPDAFESTLQLVDTSYEGSSMTIRRDVNTDASPVFMFAKSRSGSKGGHTSVNSGDNVGRILFYAADGTDTNTRCAEIRAQIDGTPGSNDMPGRLTFYTTADGANSPTERMRIDNSGNVAIGPNTQGHGLLTLSQSASAAFNALVIQQGNTGSADSDGLHIGIDSGVDAYITHKENRALAFGTANTERMRILSGGGLTFNGDTAQANALDDYEEGTWTPRFVNSSDSGSNISAQPATRLGRYTKIGNRVLFNCWLNGNLTTTETTDAIRIDGLPFNANSDNSAYAAISQWNFGGFSTYKDEIIVRNNTGGDQLILQRYGADLTFDDIVKSGINFMLAGHYSI